MNKPKKKLTVVDVIARMVRERARSHEREAKRFGAHLSHSALTNAAHVAARRIDFMIEANFIAETIEQEDWKAILAAESIERSKPRKRTRR